MDNNKTKLKSKIIIVLILLLLVFLFFQTSNQSTTDTQSETISTVDNYEYEQIEDDNYESKSYESRTNSYPQDDDADYIKQDYDPKKEDKIIEEILIRIQAGQY